jgi:TPP-dependent pyruvate/acetoin dehydrogenase alpha subunit
MERSMTLKDDDLIQMYRWMVLTRVFEQRACDLQYQRNLPELEHASIGQEAIGVGACYGLRPDDLILPSLRTRAAFFLKGVSPDQAMAGIYGKATGAARGKETSHHMGDKAIGLVAGSGVVGGSIAVAVGTALACKLLNTSRVTLCFFGDGASNRGDFHESLNLAAVQKVPAIFICENNMYALSTPASYHLPILNVADRAASYGMPGVVVDGNEVVAVHDAVQQAVTRAREQAGPSLIECKTYRWRGHSERDLKQGSYYRTSEEVEQWKTRCPIKRLREQLLSRGALTEASVRHIDEEMTEVVDKAVAFAEESPYPAPEEALENVYATQDGSFR